MEKLEIGSGNNPTGGYTHLDINPASPHVEIVGDIMSIIVPNDYPGNYSDLEPLVMAVHTPILLYDEILLIDFIEHIHWLHQPLVWGFLSNLLTADGKIVIETPDLEWIIKTYYRNRDNKWYKWLFKRNIRIKFPQEDHPDIVGIDNEDLSKWLVFKLYSGGSYNQDAKVYDYHLGLYDRYRLKSELEQKGFSCKITRDLRQGKLEGFAKKIQAVQIKDYYDGQ